MKKQGKHGERKMKQNIVLIGMPGVGKSTIGVILAKEMGYEFMDSDLLIQKRENRLLKEIIEQEGTDVFLRIEDEVNASICTEKAVIATGGSAVYGESAMKHLKETAIVIYLKLPYDELESRLGNLHNRGVVLRDGQTLRDIYNERSVLYEKYADLVVDETGRDIEETLQAIEESLQECGTAK
jgi:shikimate kinase